VWELSGTSLEGPPVDTNPSSPSPSPPDAAGLEAELVALLQQSAVPDNVLLDAAHDVALANALLQQQDLRCAAHTAQLKAEGWFDPPAKLIAANVHPQQPNNNNNNTTRTPSHPFTP